MAMDVRIPSTPHTIKFSLILCTIVFIFGTQVCHLFHLYEGRKVHGQTLSPRNFTSPQEPATSSPKLIDKPDENFDVVFGVVTDLGEWGNVKPLAKAYDRSIQKFNIQGFSTFVAFFACHDQPEMNVTEIMHSTNLAVLLHCDDSYDGLLNKTRTIRKWVWKNLSFRYLVKVDTDVVLNLNFFFNAIDFFSEKHPQRLYAGDIRVMRILTDPTSKWADVPYGNIQSIYPIYANGYFYILSFDLVGWMVDMETTGLELRQTRNEDSFVGMMLSVVSNVTYIPLGYHKMLVRQWCKWGIICHTRPTPNLEQRLRVWKQTYLEQEPKKSEFQMGKIWNELVEKPFTVDQWYEREKSAILKKK